MIIGTMTDIQLQKNYNPTLHQLFSKSWRELANGNHTTYDLGALTDKRKTKVTVLGLHDEVRALENYLLNFKYEEDFQVQLDDGEYIFGPEVVYEAQTFTCFIRKGALRQINFTDSTMDLDITLKDVNTLEYVTPVLTPSLDPIVYRYQHNHALDGKTEIQLNYDPSGAVVGSNVTERVFKASASLLDDEWIAVKTYILANRSGVMTLPDMPISPFGSALSGPYPVKLLKWQERRSGLTFWDVTFEFALEIP